MRIYSRDRDHYAALSDDHPGGVRVRLWYQPGGRMRRQVRSWVIDCPWHVALDRVHAILASV